ncbi:MAG: cysteine--tRNA ligase [Candidatus Woesearchaeota archaeon]
MEEIMLYNTLTRKKERYNSIVEGKTTMYSCGPTVYNHAHIGNLRSYIFADMLKKMLIMAGYDVNHVMNITDVDDKTIRKAIEQQKSLKELTVEYESAFKEDLNKLFVTPADHYPRATDYIEEMVGMIEKMIEKGYAYKTNDGIYYKVSEFNRYEELAMLDKAQLKAGGSQRVSSDEYDKDNPNDFALWKYPTQEDGDVYWETRIGKGRPGWHIECSAMSTSILGERIDIHTGGIDLIFPHHTNEIAQSESICKSCNEKDRFVNYWMHNEHLLVDGKKMAKRYNNFYTLKDITRKGYSPRAVRYILGATHYRQQLNFTFESLDRAEREIQRISDMMIRLKEQIGNVDKGTGYIDIKTYEKEFKEALYDDLNVSKALFAVNSLMSEVNKKLQDMDDNNVEQCIQFLKLTDSIFQYIDYDYEKLTIEEENLIKLREGHRKNKEYEKADKIRREMSERGIELRDTKEGPVCRKKTISDKSG